MKTKKATSEEQQCENSFRITPADQQGGIFSHENRAVIKKRTDTRLTDILSQPVNHENDNK